MATRRLALDAGLAMLVAALSLAMLAGGGFGDSHGARSLDALGVVLALASALPLGARRSAPMAVYLVTAAASLALDGLDYPFDVPFGPIVAIYSLAVARGGDPRPARRWVAMAAVALFVPATAAAYRVSLHDVGAILPELLFWAALVSGVWIAGDRTRLRRERVVELEERAGRTEREAERERRLAAAEERTRIARELHDSAGHAINVILVQASAARLLLDRDPDGSRRAMATIEEVARDTIGEIDRLVRALRRGDPGQPPVPADPAAFDELLERHRAGGLRLVTDLQKPSGPLPRGAAWAAYRILQEALTNAARHGDGSAAVSMRFDPDQMEITVTNRAAGGGPAPRGGGHGIAGMRERATLLGGTLDAGGDDGVFRLHARLPCARDPA